MIKTPKRNIIIKLLLAVILTLSAIVLIIGSFFNGIGVDASILLVEMERIAEGYIPYRTMHLNYPPLWFYVNVMLKYLFHVPYGCYPFYLAIHWLYVLSCALCLYYISTKWKATQSISIFVAWLFLVITHWIYGNEILLEIPSLLWGLLSLCFYLKFQDSYPTWQIIVGILACCSFLTKQFGIGFLLLLLWLLMTSSIHGKWQQIGYYLTGYFIPLFICFICWGTDMYNSILFNGYGTDTMNIYFGNDISIVSKLMNVGHNLLYFINRIAPITYIALFIIPLSLRQGRWREISFCLFGIFGFSFQFLFVQGGLHYYLYMIPFALLFIPIMANMDLNKYICGTEWVLLGITMALGIYSAYYNRVWKHYLHNGRLEYEQQWAIGAKISAIVKEGGTIFIPHCGICSFYYTANLYPPCMADIGYGVGPMELNIDAATTCVYNADYVLHYTRQFLDELYQGQDYEYFYTESLQQYVNQFPSDTIDGEIVLHHLIIEE